MKEKVRTNISKSTKENMAYVRDLFKDTSDMVFREFNCGNILCALVYIDGMADKILLDDYVVEPLMEMAGEVTDPVELKSRVISVSDMREVKTMTDGLAAALSGETLLFIDGYPGAIIIATRSWPNRGVSEPSSETVIRGPREGFTETIRFNTALLRRRIRDVGLKVEASQCGVRSKTDIALVYIDDIVNIEVLKELRRRLKRIDIDAILDSGYIEQFIEDNENTPFPQVQSTERPDVVSAALYEGRIGIIVDGSPFVLIVPAVLVDFFQAPDDYYSSWITGTFVRFLRLIGIMTSLIMPALYVAVTSFHADLIPTKLAYTIAASREGVPFPAYVEVFLMEAALAFLIQAIIKLPKAISSTIGIVGGLIIGQSAVSAGLVSPIMIIILGTTAITTFLIPNYEVTAAFTYFRIMIIILSAVLGLYGIMLGVIFLVIHLTRIKSFGIPYLAPAVDLVWSDMKDLFVRLPLNRFIKRPEFLKPRNTIRQKEDTN
ncbi:MAG: spore germination protein [Clostridium sp.]|uniref:spore germination protein n=1 Tax=Clostridium culturomicium TaxID=1499683 RepID=UPI00058D06E7|nr:spore germination protein [Clostridium culturomicium]MDU4892382.1 spore germination protein [Clostridium sp.]MDU7085756.1 spore germination protein [Clostridium sp.]